MGFEPTNNGFADAPESTRISACKPFRRPKSSVWDSLWDSRATPVDGCQCHESSRGADSRRSDLLPIRADAEGGYVVGPHDGEVAVVDGGDLGDGEPFGHRDK